ncbi:pyridoxine 4-dehydrogenase [Geosmithia morbida]|uniref:Pyridoxine 4-dehydrogenase n=1 Tax=Geosmithia morbida TaxID=1094350 RepID=A0A9P4YYD7_9HYPO|nr:pyridoxine 4-dehydrogenase [Geosmithia morbida]KAF4124059.1 pyridoxine 4-dehydrogenase [Geosmithia morbida]
MPRILDKTVGPIGFGLMGLSWRPEPAPLSQTLETLKAAIESGATCWNGAEFYGTPEYNSMTLLKHYFTRYPEDASKITLIIKGGVNVKTLSPEGSPEAIRRSADNILEQLGGVVKVDMFCIARRDARSDFSQTLSILQREYVDTGKFGGISLSECSAATVHEAVKHANITGAEVELSMFSPDILRNGVAAACAEHDIPVIAYSPIGRGLLTGRIKSKSDVAHLGHIGNLPRFQDENIAHNLRLVEKVEAIAAKKSCTPAQLAIAWVRSVSRRPDMPTVVPIPGATTASRVKENSTVIELSDADVEEIDSILDGFETAGRRYPAGAPIET